MISFIAYWRNWGVPLLQSFMTGKNIQFGDAFKLAISRFWYLYMFCIRRLYGPSLRASTACKLFIGIMGRIFAIFRDPVDSVWWSTDSLGRTLRHMVGFRYMQALEPLVVNMPASEDYQKLIPSFKTLPIEIHKRFIKYCSMANGTNRIKET